MAIKTRLDGRSHYNNSFMIVCNKTGDTLAVVEACNKNVELYVNTSKDVHIEKSNGAILRRKE